MEAENKKVKVRSFHWKRLLNYKALVRQMPFFLFLTFLAVIYIYNGHLADKTMRDITKSTNELKELQYEYKSVRGDVLDRSKQSELIEAVQPMGLRELTNAPAVLRDSSREE